MSKVDKLMEQATLKVFRSITEVTTMALLELYVKGLNSKDDEEVRTDTAMQIHSSLKAMPDQMKDAVIIELMSALTEAVDSMKKAGIKI